MAQRKAVAVDDDHGIYSFALGADAMPYSRVSAEAAEIKVVEALRGWGQWRWSIRVDGQPYFVTGDGEPRERAPRA